MELLGNHRENEAESSAGEVFVDREVEIVEENGKLNGVASHQGEGFHDHTFNAANANTTTTTGSTDQSLPGQNLVFMGNSGADGLKPSSGQLNQTAIGDSGIDELKPSSSQLAKTARSRQNNGLGLLSLKLFDEKFPLKKKLKLLKELATVKDDGTEQFTVPGDVKPQTLDFGTGVVYGGGQEEYISAGEVQDLPPLQIVMLIVGTRGDVQQLLVLKLRAPQLLYHSLETNHSGGSGFTPGE